MSYRLRVSTIGALSLVASSAGAAGPTAGYPEAVVQWGVQKGETCEDVSQALYGSPKHVLLVNRYNRVSCKKGEALPEGLTLVMPEKVGTVPDAKLRSMNPDVQARPPGSGWNPASTGMPLVSNSSVNTLDNGRADVEFVDRTRVFLAPNTLVVIYGTANQTKVSKTPPVAVEVESGEVKAGLAAMRGNVPREAVEVAIKGGGRVSAASRDTVVQRKGARTTVAVFDGKAGVSSGGKSVEVPKNFGTRFEGTDAPAAPRALPAAPAWAAGDVGGAALAPGNQGLLAVTWEAVPAAQAYRLEVARDEAFNTLLVREEVPSTIHAFRAEKMPAGTYHVRVRAIDKEEYLGVASTDRVIRLVEAKIEIGPGTMTGRSIQVNPYGALRFTPTSEVEMALDDGPFGPIVDRLELQKRAPASVKLRPRGGTPEEITVTYGKVGAELDAAPSDDRKAVDVKVTLNGLKGIDVAKQVAPSLRVRLPSGVVTASIPVDDGVAAGNAVSVRVPLSTMPDTARVDVVDGRGAVLGTLDADLSDRRPKKVAPLPPEPPPPRLGATAPLWQLSSLTDLIWSSPTAPNAAAVSAGLVQISGKWATQGQVRASGSIGPVGADLAIRSNATEGQAGDGSAWLGGRYRIFRIGRSELELAPIVRLGIPTSAASAPPRLEAGLAVGGAAGRFTWLVNAGERARLGDSRLGGAPPVQGYLLGGGTVDLVDWLRVTALIDAHVLHQDAGTNKAQVGFGAGVEAGTTVFGGASVRVTPTAPDGESAVSAQLSFGVRQVAP